MFYKWVAAGAMFGIEAFFAVFTFLLFCAAVIGLLGIGAKIVEGNNGKDNRPY